MRYWELLLAIIIFHRSELWKAKFFIQLCIMSNISHVRPRRHLTFDHSWEWRWIRGLARQYTAELGGKDIVLSVHKLLMLRRNGSSVAVRPRKMVDSPKWCHAWVRLDPRCHMAGSVYLAYFVGVVENITYEAVLRNADHDVRFLNQLQIFLAEILF